MQELILDKTHDETRQGEAFAPAVSHIAPFHKHFYIESYGCAMNFADSEVVASILQEQGFGATNEIEIADLILLNTCSIREKAEQTIRKRLTEFRKFKNKKSGLLVSKLIKSFLYFFFVSNSFFIYALTLSILLHRPSQIP